MDCKQQTHNSGTVDAHCSLKFVNFETQENHISHETQELSKTHLVVRRGKPFRLTLMFHGRVWKPYTDSLVLEVCLGNLSERIPVQFSDKGSDPQRWSAKIYPGNVHPQSATIYVCSPVLSSVALYDLLVHIETKQNRRSYAVGTFVLLCNPWLRDDPVYMPLDVQLQEYIKSDYGLVYTGTNLNVTKRPWSFGQYEPGVLEACLKLLEVSPQHLSNKHKDRIKRADPVYLSRVVCAMVNMSILKGRWEGNCKGCVKPPEWSSSADILHRWVTSKCSPVHYGQCWVFASVLCTVMRVLGIPSRVVTVFNAGHDCDASLKIEEYYSSTGEKLNLSRDSIWNFNVWVECWMRRPDLGAGFDGWQVLDPTPQKKSGGIFCCGPCPVVAIQQHCLHVPYDTPFIYASVNADIIRLTVHDGLVVGRMVDTKLVGQLIYTKSIGSDRPENITQAYKSKKKEQQVGTATSRARTGGLSPNLEVSLNIDRMPSLCDCIRILVTVTNHLSIPRVLMEHINAEIKDYNSNPHKCFWRTCKEVHMQPGGVLMLSHVISPTEYESALADNDIVNLAVVIKDVRTKETALAAQEFNISSPEITIEIEGGGSIQMKNEHVAHVSFTNKFTKTLNGCVLTVKGSGLLQGKHEARMVLLKPGQKIEKKVSIMATSPGTKLLMATFSYNNSPNVVAKGFYKVSCYTYMTSNNLSSQKQVNFLSC